MSPNEGALIGIGAPFFMVMALGCLFTIAQPPKRLMLFCAGACTGVVSLIGENYAHILFKSIFSYQATPLIQAFLLVALIEELAKLGLINGQIVEGRFVNFQDFAILAAWVGAGFAGAENLLYIIGYGPTVVFSRILTAAPFHIFNSIIASRFLWSAVVKKKPVDAKIGLIIAVFFHGLYDYLILIDSNGVGKFWFALAMTASIALGLMGGKRVS